jgi:hypothetical protein
MLKVCRHCETIATIPSYINRASTLWKHLNSFALRRQFYHA